MDSPTSLLFLNSGSFIWLLCKVSFVIVRVDYCHCWLLFTYGTSCIASDHLCSCSLLRHQYQLIKLKWEIPCELFLLIIKKKKTISIRCASDCYKKGDSRSLFPSLFFCKLNICEFLFCLSVNRLNALISSYLNWTTSHFVNLKFAA